MFALACNAGCTYDPLNRQPLVGDSRKAFSKHLVRAEQSAAFLAVNNRDEDDRNDARAVNHLALSTVLPSLREDLTAETWGSLTNGGLVVGDYLLEAQVKPGDWDPGLFDRFCSADEVEIPRHKKRYSRDGVGTPLVGIRRPTEESTNALSYYAKRGLHLPVTATLEFPETSPDEKYKRAILRLADPRFPANHGLAADFTAPLEKVLGGGGWEKNALLHLFRPEVSLRAAGVFLLEPYDPKKVVVLFSHGLDSAPHIWREMIASLMADPEIGPRCQFWYFHYPTGLMVTGSGKIAREKLRAIRGRYDVGGNDSGFNHMMLVGHSMGGLVSRLQVIDSENAFWESYFKKPISEMKVSEATRKTLTRSLLFERQPFVSRVVFIATPHRGSKIADLNIARWLMRWVRLPARTAGAAKDLMTANYDSLNPAVLKFRSLGATSVEMLSPEHPIYHAFESRPILVPYHLIIGDRGKGDSPNSSDGVVPYQSSHLSGAVSEKIVPQGHSCTDHPETLEEVRRILLEHLASVGL